MPPSLTCAWCHSMREKPWKGENLPAQAQTCPGQPGTCRPLSARELTIFRQHAVIGRTGCNKNLHEIVRGLHGCWTGLAARHAWPSTLCPQDGRAGPSVSCEGASRSMQGSRTETVRTPFRPFCQVLGRIATINGLLTTRVLRVLHQEVLALFERPRIPTIPPRPP